MKTQTAIQRAKTRDKFTCQECGSKHKVQAHHNIRGDDTSLITLCAECHSKRHPNISKLLFLNSNHVEEPKTSMKELIKQYGDTNKAILNSILHQKANGTYERNQQIRKLASDGENYAQIGRWFKLSRQAIRIIVNEAG